MATADLLPSTACTLKRVRTISIERLSGSLCDFERDQELLKTNSVMPPAAIQDPAAEGKEFREELEEITGFDKSLERFDVSVSDQAVVSPSGSQQIDADLQDFQNGATVNLEAGRRVSLDALPSEGRRLSRGGNPSPIMKQPEEVESVAAKAIRLLLRPVDWKPPADRSFPLRGGEVIDLCMQTEALVEKESSCLKVQAPVKVFGDIHGQYADLMRLFAAYGSPSKLDANGDISAYDYLFLGQLMFDFPLCSF